MTVTQPTTVAYLSTFDIIKPHKRNELFQRYGITQGFYEIIKALGYDSPVDNQEFSHFEQGWMHDVFKVKNDVSATGAGNDITLTVHADSVNAQNKIYPQLNDDVMNPRNEIVGTITGIAGTASEPTITISPWQSTDDFGALTAGDEIIIYSNSYEEGTGQPESRISEEDEYTFYLKIIKGTTEATGSAMVTRTWFDRLSESGAPIPSKFMLTDIEEDARVKMRIEGAMWFDRPATNTSLNKNAMQGLIPWVRNNGNVSNVDPGLFSLVHFDVMKNKLDQEQAPNEMFGCLGTNFYTNVENTLIDFLDNGAGIWANFDQQKSAKDLVVDFRSFSKGGRKYHLSEMKIWNHPKLFGAANSKISSKGVWMPMDIKKDKRSGRKIPAISLRYGKLGNYSRMMEVWPTGAAGGDFTYNSQIDKKQLNYRCEVGTEFFGANRFYMHEPLIS